VATAQDKKSAFIYLDCHRRDINRRHDLCLLLAGETQQKKSERRRNSTVWLAGRGEFARPTQIKTTKQDERSGGTEKCSDSSAVSRPS
jgi:hypothetical protein